MKKQINPTIKAHLIRGAFYLLLLLAVCAIPFALAQRNGTKRAAVSKFAAGPAASGAAQATRLSGIHPKSGSQSNAGSRPLSSDVRGVPGVPRFLSAAQGRRPAKTTVHRLLRSLLPNSVYMLDDGSAEDGVGFGNGAQNFESLWMNQFDVIAGQTLITTVSVAWGTPFFPDPSNNGTAVTIAIWSDPNGDGDPHDAVLLGSVAGTIQNEGTDTFVDYTFNPPVDVSAFTSFFVGDMTPMNNGPEHFYQGLDETPPSQMRSWIAANGDGSPVDINNVGNNDTIGTIDSFGLPGNWLVRADTGTPASPTPTSTVSPTPTGTPGGCIVVNGGFETGSLPPWTDTGDTSFTGVGSPAIPHSGSFALFAGPTTSDGFIDQTIPTVAGQGYDVTFWLDNEDTSLNNRFGASFGGVTLVAEATQSAFGYTQFTFTNVVPGANADLHFIFYNPPSYFYLDDVCVTPTGGGSPTPTATPSCTPIVINGSIASGDPTQTDRLAQSGIPQTCPATTSCAIFGDPNTFRYDAYTFTNTGGAQCVTIDTNTVCNADHAIFTAAYLGSFDPSNICTNWIGDAGSSPDPDQAFQVNVDSGQTIVVVVSEVHHAGCPGYTLTLTGLGCGGTPTPTPTCTPGGGGTPGPWIAANPYPTTIVRYGFAQTATDFYVFGGVTDGFTTNAVNKYNLASGTWTSLAPMPFGDEAPTCALDESGGIVYCADGFGTNQFAAYNIASNSWTSLASDPFVPDHYGSASGFFNGKVYVAGGTSSFSNQLDVYDVASNSWSAGTPAPVGPFLLAGYHQIGQFLYVVGGFDPGVINYNTTLRLDMSTGTWDTGPTFTPQLGDFGLAFDPGTNKLYSLGGDLPNDGNFFDSTNQVNELDISAWPGGTWNPSPPDLPLPNRQANQAGFFGNGDIWSVGGLDGATFIFYNEVWHRNNGGGGCVSPTPTVAPSATATATATAPSATPTLTATATATATAPTPTATATSTTTPVVSATPTATATASHTPRPTPTPRPYPTPLERTGNCWLFNTTCDGIPQFVNMTCIDCIVNQGGLSWEDGGGCMTTCPMR